MKGLLKYLSPFAPDQSGAVSVLYHLGGIIVICDAGGCTGNVCGFDEPRWFHQKSAIFSAGLRDMDAILGRDDRLVAKLKDTAAKVDAAFAALIGTPVPAVIATDFRALKRMAEKRCGLPVITVECTGTRLYDEGEAEAYRQILEQFAVEGESVRPDSIGVLGLTPLDVSCLDADVRVREYLRGRGCREIACYGMEQAEAADELEAIRHAGGVSRNLAVSPAGLQAAKYLEKRFGTPYETGFPFLTEEFGQQLAAVQAQKALVIHQQIAANEIRERLEEGGVQNVVVASWFQMDRGIGRPQDRGLSTEEEFVDWVRQEQFDLIVGDGLFRRPLRDYSGEFIELPHFAVSGKGGL